MRQPLVAANWKMNGSNAENNALLQSLTEQVTPYSHVKIVICPPFLYAQQVVTALEKSHIDCGGQDVSEHPNGAYTGEISATMLMDVGCRFVIVGHSERRQYHRETNRQVADKALIALGAGLTPIICVGESEQQRQEEKTLDVIGEQLTAVTEVLDRDELAKIVIAYEPVWAIGTGLTATPEQAQEVHAFIRQQLNVDIAADIPLLYGGSVKPDNADSLFSQQDIDGALVGGASLVADDFTAIVKAANTIN